MTAIIKSSIYNSRGKILGVKIMGINYSEEQLNLYKKLHYIICKLNNAWYKSFAGLYADDLICLCSLLNFMNHFSNTQEIIINLEMQGEYYNAFACQALTEDYLKKQIK